MDTQTINKIEHLQVKKRKHILLGDFLFRLITMNGSKNNMFVGWISASKMCFNIVFAMVLKLPYL